ncbi:MAG: ATP-binding protein [Nitrososphaeraceae archaeon]
MSSDRSHAQNHFSDRKNDDLPDNTEHERTDMLVGPEVTTKQAWKFFSNVVKKVDGCSSSAAVPIVMTMFCDAYKDMKRRGVKIRSVTDITKNNLEHCKALMQFAEVRHISHLNTNFGVSETEHIVAPTMKDGQPLPKLIYSNSKEMIEQQQNIFDIFWRKATPADQRIKEIEEEREEEFFQVINNSETAAEIYLNLVKSVKSSALLLLPSSKALIREYKLGVLDHLIEVSNKQSQDIRISCPADDDNADIIGWLYEKAPNIKILNNTINLATKIFIVNDDTLFRVELRDLEADTFSNAFGFAIYSNNKPTVNTFKSLFELVWHSYETSEKLLQADKVQREFINTAAHELRTPIVPILNLSELLHSKIKELQRGNEKEGGRENAEEKEQLPKEMLEMAEIVLRNANRLYQLTEDILDVTRIESHTLKLRKEKFNPYDEILNIMDNFRRQTATNTNENVKVVYEPANYDWGITLVEADRRRIAQVISNLLDNATKFTNEGTITITTSIVKGKNIKRIRGGEEEVAAELVVAIKDTGTGIDPELMSRLFTKFATKSYQGTGLGLFISKSIIEAHGGRLWAENNYKDNKKDNNNNKRQHGATFYFSLPLVDSEIFTEAGDDTEVKDVNYQP